MELELNKFIHPTFLFYHLGNYVFCCDFNFFVFFGLDSRFVIQFKPKINKKVKPGQKQIVLHDKPI